MSLFYFNWRTFQIHLLVNYIRFLLFHLYTLSLLFFSFFPVKYIVSQPPPLNQQDHHNNNHTTTTRTDKQKNNARDTIFFTINFTNYWCGDWLLVNEKIMLMVGLDKNQ